VLKEVKTHEYVWESRRMTPLILYLGTR